MINVAQNPVEAEMKAIKREKWPAVLGTQKRLITF